VTFGDRVDGVFTASQHVATGMLRALEEQDLAGKVKFVGFDAGPELVTALAAGKMLGTKMATYQSAGVALPAAESGGQAGEPRHRPFQLGRQGEVVRVVHPGGRRRGQHISGHRRPPFHG